MKIFQAFLKSEFSDENIEFWVVCEDFKKLSSSFRMSSRAKKIFKRYIQAEAPREVRTRLSIIQTDLSHFSQRGAPLLPFLLVLIVFPFLPDQHWSEDEGNHQAEHRGAFCSVFWRCPKDRLRVNGERLLPTFPQVWHLQDFNGLHVPISEDVRRSDTWGFTCVKSWTLTLRPVMDYLREAVLCACLSWDRWWRTPN